MEIKPEGFFFGGLLADKDLAEAKRDQARGARRVVLQDGLVQGGVGPLRNAVPLGRARLLDSNERVLAIDPARLRPLATVDAPSGLVCREGKLSFQGSGDNARSSCSLQMHRASDRCPSKPEESGAARA